jgi:hypothetical protein
MLSSRRPNPGEAIFIASENSLTGRSCYFLNEVLALIERQKYLELARSSAIFPCDLRVSARIRAIFALFHDASPVAVF